MMEGPFKFRYASELAGGFVLLAILLLIVGIFIAGHAQGWFEGRFVLHTVFETEEGSFGLNEGDEVRIRDTVAGRVGKIIPNDSGDLETTFVILNRFKPFVHVESIARVKRMFGVTGDAFVEIAVGRGELVNDGDWIVCTKDEELMETAQQFIAEFKEVLLPLLEDFRQLIERSNRIAGGIDASEGMIGAMVRDEAMATDVKQIVRNMDSVLVQTRQTLDESHQLVTRIAESLDQKKGLLGSALNDERLLTDVQDVMARMNKLLGDVTTGLDQQEGLAGSMLYDRNLADSVTTLIDDFSALTDKAEVTLEDVDRLAMGAQQHWLLRKHIPQVKEDHWLYPGQFRGPEASRHQKRFELALERARSMNSGPEIAHAAVNMAVLLLPTGDEEEVDALLQEARTELTAAGESAVRTRFLEAEQLRRSGAVEQALALMDTWLPQVDSSEKDLRLYGILLRADLQCDLGRGSEARDGLDPRLASSGKIESRFLLARAAAIHGRIHLLEGNPALAAERFDQAADLAREAGSYLAMAELLESAGAAYEEAGNGFAAADRYFRASRSIYYGGLPTQAWRVLERALPPAVEAGDQYQVSRINRLRDEIDLNRD